MSLTKECCTSPAVEWNYEPKGSFIELGDLSVYEAGDPTSTYLLINAYDIFGFGNQLKQVSDKMAAGTGYRVAMPGFFRGGTPWDINNFPPADRNEVFKWIAEFGAWERTKVDLLRVIEHYKGKGVTTFGIFGICWGGKISINAGGELEDIKASGLVHPSGLTMEEAQANVRPIIFLPSKDEPDLLPLYNACKDRLGADASEHVRFDDMPHGFVGARGDFKDELNKKRVDEVLNLLTKFFKKHLN